jgi:hypothetical protein
LVTLQVRLVEPEILHTIFYAGQLLVALQFGYFTFTTRPSYSAIT